MEVLEFFAFTLIMIASVLLSLKRNREKKESLENFERLEAEENKKRMHKKVQKEYFEEEEDEQEVEHVKTELPPIPSPKITNREPKIVLDTPTSPVPPAPLKIELDTPDKAFDIHKGAFIKRKVDTPESNRYFVKLKSLQDAIVIQEIMNKPKGM